VLAGGAAATAHRVVVAAGISPFARRPIQFDGIAPELASHTSAHNGFGRFKGQSVAVIGAGQSALESAALLREEGAHVEVIARERTIHWLRYGSGSRLHAILHSSKNPFRPILYPPSDVGPPGINFLVDKPYLFKGVPTRTLRARLARRAIRPAGAGWLRCRLATVSITTGTAVTAAEPIVERLRLHLSDGSAREVDHALLGTGYEVDVARYPFLTPEILHMLQWRGGYPLLAKGFESSVQGLHFLGAPAAESFGPIMRFVAGTGFAARSVTHLVTGDGTGNR
jgi:hypothetical protein